MERQGRHAEGQRDRGHRAGGLVLALVIASAGLAGTTAAADSSGPVEPSSPSSAWDLSAFEGAPDATTESTIVEVPVSFTLKAAEEGRVGFRLRLSVFFAWNDVRFEDVDGDDIAASLRTLTVVPGAELVVPVGEHWLVRPYAQVGGVEALGMDGNRWLASLGTRVGHSRELERWRLLAGGRIEYTTVLDEGGRRVDDVAFLDLGAGFSWPLRLEVVGGPAYAGLFLFPRLYLDSETYVGKSGLTAGGDVHLEVGVSFETRNRPKLWFASLPSWYGAALRLAPDHRSFRVYLGFPF